MFLLHQCVDVAYFNKISGAAMAKQAWDILEKFYTVGEKVKKVRLQVLQRQYELLSMKENEKVVDFFIRVRSLTNIYDGWMWRKAD